MKNNIIISMILVLILSSVAMALDIPRKMNYQGYAETSSGIPIDGDGYFKFAIINDSTSPTVTYWCNDCSGISAEISEPTSYVTVPVSNGVFTVKLGEGMSALTENVFQYQTIYIRVWFSDDGSAFEQMSPDTEIISSAYAFKAQTVAANAVTSIGIADGSITSSDIDRTNLDSDTLDGSDSTDFASSGHVHTESCDQGCVNDFEARIAALEQLILTHFSRTGNDIYITGANVHVKSGGSSTDDTVDGTGNIIIGFNEGGSQRTGSHNLIVGSNHNYSSYGGIVVGFQNTISQPYASVSGGEINTANGFAASVSGGSGNIASGGDASVSGGNSNVASGSQSSVSGGLSHEATNLNDWRAGTLFEDQ